MRGVSQNFTFHADPLCDEITDPEKELPLSKAMKMGMTLCDCVPDLGE